MHSVGMTTCDSFRWFRRAGLALAAVLLSAVLLGVHRNAPSTPMHVAVRTGGAVLSSTTAPQEDHNGAPAGSQSAAMSTTTTTTPITVARMASLWDRRLLSQPHAALFLNDEPLQLLMNAARHKPEVEGCISVNISGHLVAGSASLHPRAEICHLRRLFVLCDTSQHRVHSDPLHFSAADDEWYRSALSFSFLRVSLLLEKHHHGGRASRRISPDPDIDRWIGSVIGPLDFRLVAELQPHSRIVAGFSVYDDNAHEYLMFIPRPAWSSTNAVAAAATATTTMRLSVKLMHSDYWAVNEVHHRTQMRRNQYVLPKGFSVVLPPQPSLVEKTVVERAHRDRGNGLGDGDDLTQLATCLPGIRADAFWGPLRGWWRWDEDRRSQSPPAAAAVLAREGGPPLWTAALRGYPMRFGGAVDGREKLVNGVGAATSLFQVPRPANPRPLTGLIETLSSKRLLQNSREAPRAATRWTVTGDSQSRSLYWALKDYQSNVAPQQQLDVHLHYEWDNYLENLTRTTVAAATAAAPPAQCSFVVAGMGAHHASWGQYTFRQYSSSSVKVASEIVDSLQRFAHLRVVWYGAPAWPKPKLVDKFRITNVRLGLFNYLALEALQSACDGEGGGGGAFLMPCQRLDTLDFFGLTLGVLGWSKDGSHFDKSMVVAAVADALIAKAHVGPLRCHQQ